MTEEEKFKIYLRILNEENSIDKKEEAMLGLLGLYYKQQTEIEELKDGQIEFWISDKEIEERIKNKFISKDKIKEKLLEPIRKEAEEINKKFFEKDTGFEIEGAILQELGAIEGMILELLEE